MTFGEIIVWAETLLKEHGVPESRLDALYLLEDITGVTRSQYMFCQEDTVPKKFISEFSTAVMQRSQRVPVQYITGKTEFMGLPFLVNENVLIPRQDTECLLEELLPLANGKQILDLCTGSGCIAISLAVLAEDTVVTAGDISPGALEVARENAVKNQASIQFVQGDLFENISGKFDLIVSNPPYIESKVLDTLMPEVKEYEPILALDGKEDGLHFYREIIRYAPEYLKPGGMLAFEIGYNQYDSVCKLMQKQGFVHVYGKKDLAGLDRMVLGCKS